MKAFVILSSAVLVSGCLPMGGFRIDPTGSPESFAISNVISGRCGAQDLQSLLDQPESALENVALPANYRIIRPGVPHAKNADRGRLNIGISADGTIVQVDCG